jgi:hypothetical protein
MNEDPLAFFHELLRQRHHRPTKEGRCYDNQEERTRAQIQKRLQRYSYLDVNKMTIAELKQAVNCLGVDTSEFLEKSEFVEAVSQRRGTGCPLCLSDFKIGEPLYITKCGHSAHFECLVKWFEASSLTEGGDPKCPSCNQNPFKRPSAAVAAEQGNESAERSRKRRRP